VNRTWKQPNESRLFTYDFTDQLLGRAIQNVLATDSVARSGGTTLTLVGSANTVGPVVQVEWDGGAEGVTYLTTVRVQDSQGQEHELEGEIVVGDVQFTLPPGVASLYLTGEEYIDRYGFEETVRLTDQDRKGIVDKARLQAAISDAQELVDSYLGVRYALPISPVPTVVKSIVARLAREKLFAQRPLPQVTAEADRARSELKDLSAGRASLAISTGEIVDVAPTSMAAHGGIRDANIFNACKLADF
jgi:phage gp36-like protein